MRKLVFYIFILILIALFSGCSNPGENPKNSGKEDTHANTAKHDDRKKELRALLNDDEREYIKNNPVIKLAAEHYNYPVSFYNTYENKWQGIAFDVLRETEEITGLRFEIVNDNAADWPDLLKTLENGEASMITELLRSEDREGRFLWSDHVNLSDYYALLSKPDFHNIEENEISSFRIGLTKDTVYSELFKKWYPNHKNIKEFESSDTAFDALDADEVDMVMSSQARLLAITHYHELVGYKANILFDESAISSFGFNKNEVVLKSVIDKTLGLIDIKRISRQWEQKNYDYRAKLADAQTPWLIGTVTLSVCLFITLIILFILKYREGKRLEGLVRKRTAKLNETQRNLETAVLTIQSASRDKSALFNNINFEIRTALNATLGMIAIGKSSIKRDRYVKDIQYCFSRIEESSYHLINAVNSILDISEIEIGKFDLTTAEFNFERMLQRAVNVVNSDVREKQQVLTINMDNEIPKTLIGDSQRLSQIITNLLKNASDNTPETGEVTLKASLVKDADSGNEEGSLCTMQVSVSDTGTGLTEEQKNRLFKQKEINIADNELLSFSICKNLVEMMGGEIKIESKPEKGSVFTFSIRMKKGNEKQSMRDKKSIWENIRVLIVDNDPDSLEYLKGIVQGFGARCDVAVESEEAFRLIRRNGIYDIYFIDWKSSEVDGLDIVDALRTNQYIAPKSAVVMMSAVDRSYIEKETKKLKIDKYLLKPLFPSVISDTISEFFGAEQKQKSLENNPDIKDIFKGCCVLLAEDMEINREIVQAILEPTGLEIDCVKDGEEAVEMFIHSPEKYDMIFMDIQMPKMNGYEATRRIRNIDVPRAKTIPIVALTANVFRGDVERSIESGMNGHVGKPIDFDEIINNLQKYLKIAKIHNEKST